MKHHETDLGAKIRAYRKKKGLTLNRLSEKTGIAASNLSSIELSKTSPTVATLIKIAAAFGTAPGAFLDSALREKAVPCKPKEIVAAADKSEGLREFSLTGRLNDNALAARVMRVESGAPPFRVETGETECFIYMAAGEVIATVGDDEFLLNRGDGLYLLSTAAGTMENFGSDEAVLIRVCVT